jgi:cytidylate kinase
MDSKKRPYFRSTDYIGSTRYRKLSMASLVVAIDGPAASGKGTLARRIAERLNFAYLDTGSIYRCAALYLLRDLKAAADDGAAAVKAAEYVRDNLDSFMLSNPEIRAEDVAQATSKIAANQDVRDILLDAQRKYAENPPENEGMPVGGAILDGRDIGTVVCPKADVKLYITASSEVRAKRRYDEVIARGHDADYDAVLAEMIERDKRDSERDVAPLKPADDAFVIDTSGQDRKEVLSRALDIIRGHLAEQVAKNAP